MKRDNKLSRMSSTTSSSGGEQYDTTIHADVRPIYEALREKARNAVSKSPLDTYSLCLRDYANIDGRKVTCVYYLHPDRDGKGVTEQFEYYDYRYIHRKPFTP